MPPQAGRTRVAHFAEAAPAPADELDSLLGL